MARRRASEATSVALSQDEERVRLRQLQSVLDARRDLIADVDLEIEDLLRLLSDFEASVSNRLAQEHAALARVDGLVRHLDRWRDLLDEEAPEEIAERAARLDARRQAETERLREMRAATGDDPAGDPEADEEAPGADAPEGPDAGGPAPDRPAAAEAPAEARPDRQARLKTAYRTLARRFHPDLARTENERVEAGRTMGRINELYHLGDLARLEALAEQVKGGEIDAPELGLEEQLSLLEERLVWFDAVLESLRDERARVERSPTCELMRNADLARAAGRDLVEEIREDLRRRAQDAWRDVSTCARGLEEVVSRYNARHSDLRALAPARRSSALEKLFDPAGGQVLARLALGELATDRSDPGLRREAASLEAMAAGDPAGLRLLLMAWVSQLSPFPLPGLGSWDDLALRFHHLGRRDPKSRSLEEVLADLSDVVEYGVRRATERVAHVGLRFRAPRVQGAVPLALERPEVRRVFRDVLGVMADRAECPGCGRTVFPVPLYRSAGLDDLRAVVCPACGATHQKYWMPKGDDVQAVLNPAYLDLEIVTEWSVRLSRARLATQLLPVEVEAMNVGDLKRRLHEDLLARYGLEIRRGQTRLFQGGRRVAESTRLSALEDTAFELRFSEDVELTEAEAVEMLRHRIRNRFR